MPDRNDELLLALGWTYEPKHRAYAWKAPSSERVYNFKRPRPYDSVDDGIAICKERGWSITADWLDPTSENSVSLWTQVDGWPQKMGVAVGGEPSELLAEAISKAVNDA